jgi:sulfite reductase (NADPH) flavoprotein alpha-component
MQAMERGLWAALVLVMYLGFCVALYRQRRAARLRAVRAVADLMPAADGATPVLVAYASQTGYAEQLAWQTARVLHTAGVPALLRALGDITTEDLQRSERALFIASTYGEGDAPDAAAGFARRTMASELPLSTLNYGVLALGDREYANFCGFGRRLDGWLQERGARKMFDRVELDNSDEAALQQWQHLLARVAGTSDLPEWEAPAFETWQLAERRLLNAGSSGGPCFHIELKGPESATWEAGDLVQVLAPADPDRPREYSIASLPQDGSLHLVVRQELHADGSLGIASGWLTHSTPIGGNVALRLRPHRNFRIGENLSRPLLLIGNGTGIAGLRSHLKARARVPAGERAACWLVFGERQSAHDHCFADEIEAWLAQGTLAHADLVYSRDQTQRRYVQHALADQAERLREWLAKGMAIYVCGSLEGMATGVDECLRDALGRDTLDRLAEEGRYRRDVY